MSQHHFKPGFLIAHLSRHHTANAIVASLLPSSRGDNRRYPTHGEICTAALLRIAPCLHASFPDAGARGGIALGWSMTYEASGRRRNWYVTACLLYNDFANYTCGLRRTWIVRHNRSVQAEKNKDLLSIHRSVPKALLCL